MPGSHEAIFQFKSHPFPNESEDFGKKSHSLSHFVYFMIPKIGKKYIFTVKCCVC